MKEMVLQHHVTILCLEIYWLLPTKSCHDCKNRDTVAKSWHGCQKSWQILAASEQKDFAIFCNGSSPKLRFRSQHTQIIPKHHYRVTLTFIHQFPLNLSHCSNLLHVLILGQKPSFFLISFLFLFILKTVTPRHYSLPVLITDFLLS